MKNQSRKQKAESGKVERMHRALAVGLAFCFLLSVFCLSPSASAAWIYGTITNNVGVGDTNGILLIPVSGPNANADGTFTSRGLPVRVRPNVSGYWVTNLSTGNWMATNAFLGSPIVFRVPDDSGATLHNFYDGRISGYNQFVTITFGTNPPPTLDEITNAFGYQPLSPAQTASAILEATNTVRSGLVTLINTASNVNNAFTTTSSNGVASYARGLTNGFVTSAITNGLSPISYLLSTVNTASNQNATVTIGATNAIAAYARGLTNGFVSQGEVNSSSNALRTSLTSTINSSSNYLYSQIGSSGGVAGTNYVNALVSNATNDTRTALLAIINTASNQNATVTIAATNTVLVTATSRLTAGTNAAVTFSTTATNDVLATATARITAGTNAAVANATAATNALRGNLVTLLNSASNSLVSQISASGTSEAYVDAATNTLLTTATARLTSGTNASVTFSTTATNDVLATATARITAGTNAAVANATAATNALRGNLVTLLTAATNDVLATATARTTAGTNAAVAYALQATNDLRTSTVTLVNTASNQNAVITIAATNALNTSSSTTNFAIAGNPLFAQTTNNLAISGAGTAAANGTFVWTAALNIWSNSTTSSYVTNNSGTFVIRDSVGSSLYTSTTLLSSSWNLGTGGNPSPTVRYGATHSLTGYTLEGVINSTNLAQRMVATATQVSATNSTTGNADTATLAANATQLGGILASGYAKAGSTTLIGSNGTETVFSEPNSLSNAVQSAVAGDSIRGSGKIILTGPVILTNLTLFGSGGFTIESRLTNTTQGAAIVPYAGSVLRDFKIFTTNQSVSLLIGTYSAQGQPALTNAVLNRITMTGTIDGLYINHTNPCTASVVGSKMTANGDMFGLFAPGETIVQNSQFRHLSGSSRFIGIGASNTNRFFGCTFEIDEDATINSAEIQHIASTSDGSLTIISGCGFTSHGTNTGLTMLANGSTSNIRMLGCYVQNIGNPNSVAVKTTANGARVQVFESSIFSDGISTNQFSANKGQVMFWGGNTDPALTSVGSANVVPGTTNFAAQGTIAAASFTGNGSGLTNLNTSFATNYVTANFTPISGQARLVMSNGVIYAVSETKTNLISDLR